MKIEAFSLHKHATSYRTMQAMIVDIVQCSSPVFNCLVSTAPELLILKVDKTSTSI